MNGLEDLLRPDRTLERDDDAEFIGLIWGSRERIADHEGPLPVIPWLRPEQANKIVRRE